MLSDTPSSLVILGNYFIENYINLVVEAYCVFILAVEDVYSFKAFNYPGRIDASREVRKSLLFKHIFNI